MKLREEFNRFIRDNKTSITYVRRNTQIRCKCTDFSTPNPNCPICYGTGCLVNVERHLARRSRYWGSDSMHGLIQPQPLGYVDSDAWVYYLQADSQPKEKDLIIDDKHYLIRRVHAERDDETIAYYRVVADVNIRDGQSDHL